MRMFALVFLLAALIGSGGPWIATPSNPGVALAAIDEVDDDILESAGSSYELRTIVLYEIDMTLGLCKDCAR